VVAPQPSALREGGGKEERGRGRKRGGEKNEEKEV
jgi:hypothetical protein